MLERNHKRLKVVVSSLLLGGLVIVIVPSLAHSDLEQTHTSRSLVLFGFPEQNHLFEDDGIEGLEQDSNTPPPRIVGEILGGAVGGVLGGGLGGLIGLCIGIGQAEDPGNLSLDELLTAGAATVVGLGIGYTLGCGIGVYSVGDTENETGDPLATLGGSVLGGALGLALSASTDQYYWGFFLCPVGATAGFNATRRYKTPPPSKNGLINFKGDGMYVATPTINLQPDPFDKGILIHNMHLLKLSF